MCDPQGVSAVKFQPAGGASDLFDVLVEDRIVGIVWLRAGRWHAAVSNMADHGINEQSRDAAADQLLRQLGAPRKGTGAMSNA
ncbi:MAG: hypothetical protein EON56_03525 [Alphaproteobacteria bacterium]|nr:MAG: hypothetical protein EON56_03525 [Alphaproteobacteria bacterium]